MVWMTTLKRHASSLVRSVFSVAALLAVSACCSTESLRKADCEQPPIVTGQCAVDAGLPAKNFDKLKTFCEKQNLTFDLVAFEKARVARENELCSTPKGVFELQFRTSAGLNGQVTCPKDLLTTKELQQATEDGKAAAFAYSQKDLNENELAHAQQRRFNADRNGYDVGLSDRTVLIDTRQNTGTRDSYKNQFDKIIAAYPGVVEQELVAKRACANP